MKRKEKKEITPLGVITGASRPRGSPRLIVYELTRQSYAQGVVI